MRLIWKIEFALPADLVMNRHIDTVSVVGFYLQIRPYHQKVEQDQKQKLYQHNGQKQLNPNRQFVKWGIRQYPY